MTSKQLLRIAVALGVLLFLWGVVEVLSKSSDTTTARFELPALTAADVDTVKISRPADTLLLVRGQADAWSVNGHLASSQALADFFKALRDTGLVEVVAESPTSHVQLGVDSAAGKRVVLIKGQATLASIVVGGRGPGFAGVFVRRPTEDRVYLFRTDLGNVLDRQLDDWRDKRIVSVEPDSVREVRVQRRRGPYVLRRADAGWRFASGAPADSGAVRRLLEQYRSFSAGGFPTPAQADSLDFKRPDRRITLTGRSAPLADLVFDSTAAWWYARPAEGGAVYRVESWRMDQLFPVDSTLKEKKGG